MKWLKAVTWLTSVWALNGSLAVVILFWGYFIMFSGNVNSIAADPFDLHAHAMITILLVVDIFLVSFPVRFLHVVYPICLLLFYVLLSLIYHWTEVTSAVYPPLNWRNDPGLAAGLSLIGSLAGTVILHSLVFGMYRIRYSIKVLVTEKVIPPTELYVISSTQSIQNCVCKNKAR